MSLSSAAVFCRRFGTGLRAGADILRLLRAEAKQGPTRQRDAINHVADAAGKGEHLSVSMDSQRPFFPPLMIAMTRAGEATGRLERALLALADHYEQRVTLRRSFLRSIAWPAIQLTGAILVISLVIWLLGILTPATGGEMKDILGLGLRGSSGVLKFWAFCATVFALIGGFVWAFSRNIAGLQNIIPLVYLVPKIGPAIQTITLARFSWTMAMALDSGLDPIRSIDLSLDSTDSDYYRGGSTIAEKAIRDGATLAESLRSTDLFPDEYLTHIEVAELSGTDAESVEGLAREYGARAEIAIKVITGILSGLIWLAVVLVILFFIVRILMFIVGMYSQALAPLIILAA
ncbi:MAG: type II secretion system F family protein [Planctomycetota bacterium]